MSKKLMELVAKALKKANVELKDDAKEALSDALGSEALKEAGFIELGSSQRVVEESEYNEVHADLRKEKAKRREIETDRDRLKSALDTGDSENKKLADRYKADLDATKPRAERLMARARADWESRAKLLPTEKADAKDDEKARITKIRGRFTFAEKDKPLGDDQLLENLAKYDELAELGVFAAPKPNGNGHDQPPPAIRGGGGGGQKDTPADPDQAALDWYAKTDPQHPQGNAR